MQQDTRVWMGQLITRNKVQLGKYLKNDLLLVVSSVRKRQRLFEVPRVGDSQEHRQRLVRSL